MSLVHSVSFRPSLFSPLASQAGLLLDKIRGSRWGIGLGLGLSTVVGLPLPVAQIGWIGPVVATLAAGKLGGRAAAAAGYVSYLAVHRPSAAMATAVAALAVVLGWTVPAIVEWIESRYGFADNASAVVIDGEGFTALDKAYGAGSSNHAFDLLKRAVEVETQGTDLMVHVEGRQLILALDGSHPSDADSVMASIERRFAGWLSDAGYECNLALGMLDGKSARERATLC